MQKNIKVGKIKLNLFLVFFVKSVIRSKLVDQRIRDYQLCTTDNSIWCNFCLVLKPFSTEKEIVYSFRLNPVIILLSILNFYLEKKSSEIK